ncbi:MAG: hypothetical protein FWG99_08150 [Treponema sp.]|nr:hypothetical protein [Treponema sp.]
MHFGIAAAVEKPHFATVRPDDNYNPNRGPKLANVGAYNNFYYSIAPQTFSEVDYKNVEWYYNKHQIFQENYIEIRKYK